MAVILDLGVQFVQMTLVLALAPLLTGYVRKVKAHLVRRQGPPLLQPYRDLLRLLRKEVVLAESASWVFRVATVFFLLRAFHIPATAYTTALVLAVQSLSTLLPFTPGGIGTQQGLIVYVFRKQRLPNTRLVSFSVGMQIALTAFNVVLGLVALAAMARSLHWRHIVSSGRKERTSSVSSLSVSRPFFCSSPNFRR